MKQHEIPEKWQGRCSYDGHKRYTDQDGVRRYVDNDEPIGTSDYRPCGKCGKYPTEDGDDYCISNLGRVMNACCGHGLEKGYIQFDNGIIISGHFEIERMNLNFKMKYEIRSRDEIIDKIEELERSCTDNDKTVLDALKWVMRYEQ